MKLLMHLRHHGSQLDLRFRSWLHLHSNLVTAFIAFSVCLWAATTHQAWVLFAIVGIGAVSYFVGFSAALFLGVIISVFAFVEMAIPMHYRIENVMLAFVGFCAVAWLGTQHQEQTEHERQKSVREVHPDQVLPWQVVNEVRTSLAAIRFLLFPLNDEDIKNHELQQATLELSRLEDIFSKYENTHQTEKRYKEN